MKLTIDSRRLRELADWAAKIAPARPNPPILGGVLLDADGLGTLSATTTDYDVWGVGQVPADAIGAGRVLVSARLLSDLASGMPTGPVELVLDGSRLTIRGGRAVATAPTMQVEDYPVPPERDGGSVLHAPGPLLSRVLGTATKIAANANPADGLHVILDATPESLRITASDKYRILACDLPWSGQGPDGPLSAMLPGPAAQALADLVKATDTAALSFPAAGGVFGATAAERQLTVRQMAGGKRIPVERFAGTKPHEFAVSRDELADLVERAGKRCVDKMPLRLTVADSTLTAVGGTDDEGSLTDVIGVTDDSTWPADGMEIGVRPDYLASMLAVCPAETVRVGATKPHLAVVLTPVGVDLPYAMTGVIMPYNLGKLPAPTAKGAK